MIRFNEVTDIPTNVLDSHKAYLDIKSTDNLSKIELHDSISKEFDSISDFDDIDEADRLLVEVFDCSEDDINVEFELDENILSCLEQFEVSTWGKLTEKEKVNAISELTRLVGDKLGLDSIPEIEICDGEEGVYGGYDPDKNVISLNKEYIGDSKELVNTITHELRHAYQHYRADILNTREDKLFAVNFDNYIAPVQLPNGGCLFFTDYYNQYVEVDARTFANRFSEAI